MLLRAQGDYWLEPGCIAGRGLQRVVLEDTGENNPGLQLRERHADAGARAAAKGKVCSLGNLLLVCWIPALRSEGIRVLPDFGKPMHDPLPHNDPVADRRTHAIQPVS